MTREERAVIDAAMAWAQAVSDDDMDRTCRALLSATRELHFAPKNTNGEAPVEGSRLAAITRENEEVWRILRQVQSDLTMALRSMESDAASLDKF